MFCQGSAVLQALGLGFFADKPAADPIAVVVGGGGAAGGGLHGGDFDGPENQLGGGQGKDVSCQIRQCADLGRLMETGLKLEDIHLVAVGVTVNHGGCAESGHEFLAWGAGTDPLQINGPRLGEHLVDRTARQGEQQTPQTHDCFHVTLHAWVLWLADFSHQLQIERFFRLGDGFYLQRGELTQAEPLAADGGIGAGGDGGAALTVAGDDGAAFQDVVLIEPHDGFDEE